MNNNESKDSMIHSSLKKLNDFYNNNILNKEDKNKIKKEYFCNEECYNKFIKIIEKIKNKQLDYTKIDWSKYEQSNNPIFKLVQYYYNLGLNSNSTKN